MLKKILVGIAVIIVMFLVVVALQPADFRVSRSTTIAAPAEVVFAQVNELKKWDAWSPWAKLDPAMKKTYEGPEAGVGAVSAWVGNQEVGEGRMTITESRPNEVIRFNLEFLKPFKAGYTAEFAFQPEGNQTTVTWSMSGKNNFVSKAVRLFLNVDQMVGGQFDQGLADLKSVAETAAKLDRVAPNNE